MGRKKTLLILLVLLSAFCLFAEQYTINSYKINVEGVTRVSAIEDLIVPQEKEVYNNETELESALLSKRYKLNDTSLFKHVSYTYEISKADKNEYLVDVVFNVEDASSFLAFPFPKYSTDDGLTLKVVLKEHNFLGMMATIDAYATASSRGDTFDNSIIEFSVPVENLKIKDTNLSFEGFGSVDLRDIEASNYSLKITESNMKVQNGTLDSSVGLTVYPHMNHNLKLSVDADLNNISIGEAKLSITDVKLSLNMLSKEKWGPRSFNTTLSDVPISKFAKYKFFAKTKLDKENSSLEVTNSFSEMHVGKLILTEVPSFIVASKSTLNDNLEFKEISNKLTVKFTDFPLYGFTIDNTFTRNMVSKADEIDTVVSWDFSKDSEWTAKVEFDTFDQYRKGLTDMKFILSASRSYKLFDFVTFVPIFEFTNTYKRADNTEKFKCTPSVAFEASVSGSYGKVHRVISGEDYVAFRDNFREGSAVAISGTFKYDWYSNYIKRNPMDFKVLAYWTYFDVVGKRINPSIRLGISADSETRSPYKDTNTMGGLTFTYNYVKDYLRGITASNKDFANAKGCILAFANVDFVTGFINFEDFGHTYLNPFMDFALMTSDNPAEKSHLFRTVGLEGVAILDSHPGYPIRVSLGFNLENIIDKFVEGHRDTTLEYELFIGLNWLY